MNHSVPLLKTVTGTLSSWSQTIGSANAPSSFAILNSVFIPAGTVTVSWSVTLSGTTGANETNNFLLVLPGLPGIVSVNASAAGTYTQAPVAFTSPGGTAFLQVGGNNATAGSVYSETILAGGGAGTLQLGPFFNETWYPAVCNISMTGSIPSSGNPATCTISVGFAPAGAQFIDSTYQVNGAATDSFQGQPVYYGQYIFATWANANPGATVALSVNGTKTIPG